MVRSHLLVRVAQDCSVRGVVNLDVKQRNCRFTSPVRALVVAVFLAAFFGWGESRVLARSDRVRGATAYESSAETVDLFEAVEDGTLAVKVIPHDSKLCRVFITNTSDRNVNVRMPAALAAVPVLAQFGNDFGQAPGGNQANGAAPQRLGVGNPFGQQNPLQAGPGMQGNPLMNGGNQPFFAPFCIAPEKVARLKLRSVCLDHGQPDPRPAMRYRLEPLSALGEAEELESVCRRLGAEQVSQRVAQAAAWYLSNGKSWEEMEAMVVHRLGWPDEPFFTRHEIAKAKQFVEKLQEGVAENEQESARGSSLSMSR